MEQHYRAWVVIPFYVVVTGYNEYTQEQEYACFRSAKRGHKKYSDRVLNRFEDLKRKMPNQVFFRWGERDRRKIAGPCVFATLTFQHDVSIEDTWQLVGPHFNRWITRLRRRFGKISVVRVFESHESGYCHVHAVLHFHSVRWRGFRWDSWENGKRVIKYRVDRVEQLKTGWRGGFADVLLMNSSRAGFNYLAKYLSKSVKYDGTDSKAAKTLALCWYFRKRSFSVSGNIARLYSDLINTLKSNSNLNCDIELRFDGSVNFCGVAEWHLYGFVRDVVKGWGDHWQKIPTNQMVKLEKSGRIEKR